MAEPLERLTDALADRYRIERELGAGGMALVYVAEDLRHRRKVAIKVLHPELGVTVGAERFIREVAIAARLQHPHILTVLDSGEADGLLWYAMPLVDGESLRQLLSRVGELPVETTIQLTREVADALDYAHEQGIVHRDIKPENILLSHGHALVADFGIARAVDDETGRLTVTGLAVGTPAYMSPEQAAGDRHISAQSDIYSLACVTFEMFTGEAPYSGGSARSIMTKRVTDPVPSARRLRSGISVSADRAIMRGLAPSPADRFVRAGDFARALAPEAGQSKSRRFSWPLVVMAGCAVLALAAIVRANRQSLPAPADAMAEHLHRGNTLLAKRTPAAATEALAEYQSALALEPENPAALAKMGYTYALFVDWGWQHQGLTMPELRARAMEHSERAIGADSTSPEAWMTRAYVLAVNDPYRMRGAVDAFTRALALDSTTSEGWYQFGQSLMALGEDARAETAYRKAFALDPNRPMALMSLSAMNLKAGRVAEAKALIDSAVGASRTVTSPYVRVVRGRIALMQGDVRVARDEADLALAMDTNYTIPARSLLATVYWTDGDTVRAAAELARLLKDIGVGDPSPTSVRYVASALVAQGRNEQALTLIERARPRGAYLWFYLQSADFRALSEHPRFKRVIREADPRSAGVSGASSSS